ncbi:MAG: hypothetical protein IPM79_39565 [Polyangiaceae bacterium]|nr:hypothetical protein [Polyangiaceae bacterium]
MRTGRQGLVALRCGLPAGRFAARHDPAAALGGGGAGAGGARARWAERVARPGGRFSALDEACSRGVLVEGECVRSALPECTPCDGRLACTTRDHCDAGACVPGGPYQCLSPDACHVAQCNVETGLCELVQANDGAPCNDSSACTASDTCEGGVCVGEELACYDPDDGNPLREGRVRPFPRVSPFRRTSAPPVGQRPSARSRGASWIR